MTFGLLDICCYCGDEFVVILGELHKSKDESTSQAQVVAEKIRASLSEPYYLTLHQSGMPDSIIEYHCSASIGAVVFAIHEANQNDVFKWADDAA
jgi:GGDEF domain-containing protein